MNKVFNDVRQRKRRELIETIIEYLKEPHYDVLKEAEIRRDIKKYGADVGFLMILDERLGDVFNEIEERIIVST